jgi:hypothetical protein
VAVAGAAELAHVPRMATTTGHPDIDTFTP